MTADTPGDGATADATEDPADAADQRDPAVGGRRVDAATVGLGLVVVTLAFLFSPIFVEPPGWSLVVFEVAIVFLVYGLITVALNLQFGYTGLVNFGPVGFFAVGAYVAAMLTAGDTYAGIGLGYGWPVGLAGGILAAGVLGVILGVSTLRLRDDFLAIVTLAVAEIIHGLVGSFQSFTGGSIGIGSLPQPIADLTGSGGGRTLFGTAVFFAALLVLCYGVVSRLTDAPYGRVLRAIRADEQVTEALGKDVFRYKLAVFVYGALVMGLAGVLYAYYIGAVSPGFYTLDVTVLVWVGLLLGGAGNHRGALAGLAIILSFRLLTRFLNQSVPVVSSDQFASIRLLLVGLLLILVIRYRPEGIWGDPDELGVRR